MCLIATNTQDLRANRRSTAWLSRLRLSALLVVLVVNVVSVRASDWPQFRGPDRDGVWKETGIMQSFPAGGLKVSWRMPVGPGWSSPVVAQGRVYVTDPETFRVLVFSADGQPLAAFGAAGRDTLSLPNGIAVASDGTIWVADAGSSA